MSLCQEGVDCVWGRRYGSMMICSIPRCPMVRLRTGNVDKLRKEFVVHVEKQQIFSRSLDDSLAITVPENAGDDSA